MWRRRASGGGRISRALVRPAGIHRPKPGTSTNMVRTRGRSCRGTRLLGRVSHGHWKITTFVAGLRCGEIAAPFVIDRPMNSAIFLTYVRQCLVPALGRATSSSWTI